jgi:hypothetical protein
MAQVHELFDKTPRQNRERLATLAEVMQVTLAEAIADSDKRGDDNETRDIRNSMRVAQ